MAGETRARTAPNCWLRRSRPGCAGPCCPRLMCIGVPLATATGSRPRSTLSSPARSLSGESTNAPPAGARSGSVRTALHRTLPRTPSDTFVAGTVPWMVIGAVHAIPNEGMGSGDWRVFRMAVPLHRPVCMRAVSYPSRLGARNRSGDGRGERQRGAPGPPLDQAILRPDSGKARHRLFAAHPGPAHLGRSKPRRDLRWLRGNSHRRPDADAGDAGRVASPVSSTTSIPRHHIPRHSLRDAGSD
jgi:hypothetical protein